MTEDRDIMSVKMCDALPHVYCINMSSEAWLHVNY